MAEILLQGYELSVCFNVLVNVGMCTVPGLEMMPRHAWFRSLDYLSLDFFEVDSPILIMGAPTFCVLLQRVSLPFWLLGVQLLFQTKHLYHNWVKIAIKIIRNLGIS